MRDLRQAHGAAGLESSDVQKVSGRARRGRRGRCRVQGPSKSKACQSSCRFWRRRRREQRRDEKGGGTSGYAERASRQMLGDHVLGRQGRDNGQDEESAEDRQRAGLQLRVGGG